MGEDTTFTQRVSGLRTSFSFTWLTLHLVDIKTAEPSQPRGHSEAVW